MTHATVPAGPPLTWTVVRKSSLSSTQDEAQGLAQAGAPSLTLVVADVQSSGRGRGGRAWFSHGGGLMFSFVVRRELIGDALPLAQLPVLTHLLACGLVDAIREHGVVAAVKWPNDIMVPHHRSGVQGPFQKVGGILVESALGARDLDYAVCGVGLNLIPPLAGFPAELCGVASSLWPAGIAPDSDAVLASIRRHVAPWLYNVDEARIARAIERLTACATVLGRRVLVDGDAFTAHRLAPDGALVVTDAGGAERTVYAGDVTWAVDDA